MRWSCARLACAAGLLLWTSSPAWSGEETKTAAKPAFPPVVDQVVEDFSRYLAEKSDGPRRRAVHPVSLLARAYRESDHVSQFSG